MLFSRTPSNNASPIKSPTKSVCRVKISYNSLHTIIGNKTSIDFHFFRDLFDISLAKDRDRNPTVLQVDIKNEREIFISKNSFTTPVLIRFSNEDTWKSLLVSDSFELKNTAFAKVDKYEIKIEKVVVQVPALESKPTKILNSPSSAGTPVRINMNERSFMQTPKTFSGTPIEDTKKKGEMRNSNLWDYFGKVLDSGKKSVVNKHVPQNQMKSQSYRTPEIEQNIVFDDDDDECSVKAILKRMAQKSEEEKKILLEKRQIGPSLSDVEDEIEADGGLHRKKLKFQNDSEDENNEDCELPTADSDHLSNKTPAFMVESSQIVLGSKRNKNKMIQLLGEEEEEKRALPAARNERMIFGGFNQKNENNYAMNMKNRIEEEKTFCSDDLKSTANKSTPIKSPTKHAACSPHMRRSLETEKSIKLKRLKKIVDDRRETLNKGSVTKEPIKSQEKEPQANKETCPICLGDIVKEVGCLSDCIHKFCFDCIKDWSDVTNECPLCKRKFNEITKYLLKEGGESVKLDTLAVEDKKQRVHDDGEAYVEEDIDECCYECRGDEDQNILLICDACGFYCCHTYCCNPPLDFIPEEDWFCKYCVQQHTRSTRRRRNATRNNNRAQPREEVPVEPRGPTRRVTRSRAQRRETLLESLFEAAEQEDLDNELANLDLYQESYFGDGGDLEDNSNTFDSTSIGTRSNNRRLNRRQNTNSREMPVAEERTQRRTRRNNREEVADFTTDLTDINDLINLENYYFNNQAPTATQRTQQQPRTSRSNTRMIIEERNMSPAMSMDDLNQFRYPLRSQGRSNY